MKNIAKALSVFHEKIGKISKDSENPFFKSSYASLPNVLEAIREPLKESGLTFTQLPKGLNGLETMLIHVESGEFLKSKMEMTPTKSDPQGSGSALTYMRRYALVSILGLNVDDDDGNEASKGISEGLKAAINDCKSQKELEGIWINHPELRNDRQFIKLVNDKKCILQ